MSKSLLFSPIQLAGVSIPNRVVVSPMCQYSSADGFSNDWHLVHLGSHAVGGAGLVSVASNEVPGEMARMVEAALGGDWVTARALYRRYFRLITANFLETNPGPVKSVLAMMGRLEEIYRLPMVPVAPANREKLNRLAEELGLLSGEGKG